MNVLQRFERIGELLRFDPDQPRDEDGKWASGGGSVGPYQLQKTNRGFVVQNETKTQTVHLRPNAAGQWDVSIVDEGGSLATTQQHNLEAAHKAAKSILSGHGTLVDNTWGKGEKAPSLKLDPKKLKAAFSSNLFGN